VKEPEEKDDVNSFSLEELLLKKPVSFTGNKAKKNGDREKKGVDKSELKKALTASMDAKQDGQSKQENDSKNTEKQPDHVVKSGKLAPGETVKF